MRYRALASRVSGLIRAPPSKSYTHRAVILAALSSGPCRIRQPLLAEDTEATIAGMAGGVAATELTIPYREDISLVKYHYDAQTRTYARFQNNAGKAVRDVDAVNNQPIAAANIAIIHTEIWEVPQIVDAAGSYAHDMRLTGRGSATIFRDGLRQEATWTRASDTEPFVFKNPAGEKILLDQGQTWVHVVPNDWEIPSS